MTFPAFTTANARRRIFANRSSLSVAVVAAFAGTVVPAITPTDSAAAASRRRAARRVPRLRLASIMWRPIWEAGWEDLGA